MDEREILTRFKAGTLGRSEAARLLTRRPEQTPAAVPQPQPEPERMPAAEPPPPSPQPEPASEPADSVVAAREGVAVVGLAGRYPMAPDPQTFWENLREGRDTLSDGPVGRPGPSPLEPGQRGHFLDAAADFDAAFFGLTAREGALMDPQERLFLEIAWEALEDAGCAGARLDALRGPDGRPRAVGVFVGVSSGDYALLAAESWAARGRREMPGSSHAGLPGRLAALLGLSGPGQIVDTGVCSALTAVHLAVQSLRRGECAAALAGGVELLLHPSRARDGAAEGVGAVVLKRLDRALADGDRVHAVVRDTSSGFGRRRADPAPGRPGPGSVGRGAPVSGIGPQETEETGEAAGPLSAGGGVVGREEAGVAGVAAGPLSAGGGQGRAGAGGPGAGADDGGAGAAGSGNSALVAGRWAEAGAAGARGVVVPWAAQAGAVAGMAGVTAAVFQVGQGVLAPARGAAQAVQWVRERDGQGRQVPRRAVVEVVGQGGHLARAVVEECLAPAGAPHTARRGAGRDELVLLSALTPAHLAATASRLADWLAALAGQVVLADVARALRVGRAALPCRIAHLGSDVDQLVGQLRAFAGTQAAAGGLRWADLRAGGADPLGLAAAAETRDYLAALWRGGRLEQLTRLWLSGVDVDWAALQEGTAGWGAMPPPSAFVRRLLWLDAA